MFKRFRLFYQTLFCVATVVFCGPLLSAAETEGSTPDPIVRVEEDWIAYIRNPDADIGAPQIINVVSPVASTASAFGMIELNHRTGSGFRSGGYQVQGWVGDTLNDYQSSGENGAFANAYDKLTYTVGIEADGQVLRFFLKDGKSRTWGRFAREAVKAVTPAYGATLEEYNPQFSADNTSINVGAHRVELMYQQRVRYYSATDLVRTDETDRLLHRFQEVVQFVSLEDYERNLETYNIEITEE